MHVSTDSGTRKNTVASISGLLTIISGSARLQAAIAWLDNLEAEARTSRFMLAFSPAEHREINETISSHHDITS